MKINEKKVRSITHLALLGMNLFIAVACFKTGDWTWGLLSSFLFAMMIFIVIKHWAWTTKSDETDDDDKTKDLKKVWRNKF